MIKKRLIFANLMCVIHGVLAMNNESEALNKARQVHSQFVNELKHKITSLEDKIKDLDSELVQRDVTIKIFTIQLKQKDPTFLENKESVSKNIETVFSA